jgi:hypothetical protein
VKARLEEGKTAEAFVDNSFDVVEAFVPWTKPSAIMETTRVTILGLTDDRVAVTRGKAVTITQPIQVGIQRLGTRTQLDLIKGLVRLWEEVKSHLEVHPPAGWTWTSTQSLKDEAGVPYEFSRLRDANTFEAIFTVFYQQTFTRDELLGDD